MDIYINNLIFTDLPYKSAEYGSYDFTSLEFMILILLFQPKKVVKFFFFLEWLYIRFKDMFLGNNILKITKLRAL